MAQNDKAGQQQHQQRPQQQERQRNQQQKGPGKGYDDNTRGAPSTTRDFERDEKGGNHAGSR